MAAPSPQSSVRSFEPQPHAWQTCAFVCGMMVTLLFTGCATIRKLNPIESSTLEARRLTQQAESAIHKSNWDEAEQKLISAIEKNPEDNRARNVLSEVLWERGAIEAAVEQKSRAIELSGRRDPYNLTELGQMELPWIAPTKRFSKTAAWPTRGHCGALHFAIWGGPIWRSTPIIVRCPFATMIPARDWRLPEFISRAANPAVRLPS